MAHVDVRHLTYRLPDGRPLLEDVSFRVGNGVTAALVGPNGAGKTTLLRLVAGDVTATAGEIVRSGGLGAMRQFIGSVRDHRTVHDLLLSVAPARVQGAAAELAAAEAGLAERDDGRPSCGTPTRSPSTWRRAATTWRWSGTRSPPPRSACPTPPPPAGTSTRADGSPAG